MNELKTPSLSCIEFHMFHATTLQLWIQYLLSNVLVPSGFRVEAYVPWVNRLLISDKKKSFLKVRRPVAVQVHPARGRQRG